jgi:TPP-dependent pyruvate/acetoin dehydrogenase alpha subunit
MTTGKKERSAAAVATTARNGSSLITNEKLLQLYAAMLKCRMIEKRVSALFPNTLSGNSDAVAGQEAAVIGVAIDLLPEDVVVSLHGGFIADFIKGMPLDQVLRPLLTRPATQDECRSEPAASIASRLNEARSAAQQNKAKKNGNIAVAFSGPGPDSPDGWKDAMRLACSQELPIVFVSRNGLRGKSQSERLQSKAEDNGFPTIAVDGNDVVAVYRVASEVIAHARLGHGPTLIDCIAFRPDPRPANGSRKLRDPGKTEPETTADPILNMERYLTSKGLFRADLQREIAGGFVKELDAATAMVW